MLESTRNSANKATVSAAILKGIADDGGLYIIKDFSDRQIDAAALKGLTYQETAIRVLTPLLEDYTAEEVKDCVYKAYTRFDCEEIAPVVKVGDRYVLELFHGPTLAFKDFALQLLPRLVTTARGKNGMKEDLMILTATSGDTGKAALEGFMDVPGTKVMVFFPSEGVSNVQKTQMVTQEGANVCVCAIRGNFDDAQTGVKTLFGDAALIEDLKAHGCVFSSANSINFGRLAPQVVYYFYAYAQLLNRGDVKEGQQVDFTVPTGNFGDILAGYIAKLMGLPVRRLVCASNANNVLTDFLTTGTYNRNREFYKTYSPSMDILISSNLERLLYMMCSSDTETASYMKALNKDGCYTVSDELKNKIQTVFSAGCTDDENTLKEIKKVYDECGYLMDTHTAVAYAVAGNYMAAQSEQVPNIVLSTASPYKFSGNIQPMFGEPAKDEWESMEKLNEATKAPIPANLAGLREKPVRHNNLIDASDMREFVLKKVVEWND